MWITQFSSSKGIDWSIWRKVDFINKLLVLYSRRIFYEERITSCLTHSFVCPIFLRWCGSDPSVDACLYASILRIPQMIWVWRATVEWYWQGKTEELGGIPVPVPLCPPQIPHGLTRARSRASAVRGRRLTTWAMARPFVCPITTLYQLHRLCSTYVSHMQDSLNDN
jgi:hypothetical protein